MEHTPRIVDIHTYLPVLIELVRQGESVTLTQEETLGMTPGVNEAIIRPKFSAESLRGARIKTAFSVIASPDKEVL